MTTAAKTALGGPVCTAISGGKHRPLAYLPGLAIATGASNPLVATRTLRRWPFPHRPDFDSPHACHCPSCGDRDRLVESCDVDKHVATKLLARFGKRTIGHEPFAVAHPDISRRRRRLQRGTSQILPAYRELVRELQLLLVDLLAR